MTLINVLSFCDILNVENKFLFNIFLVNYYVNAYFESITENIVFPDAHTLQYEMLFHIPILKQLPRQIYIQSGHWSAYVGFNSKLIEFYKKKFNSRNKK